MDRLIFNLAISLALTVILETGFALLCGIRYKRDLILICLVNVITNPMVVLVYHFAVHFTVWKRAYVIIPLEIFAAAAEAIYYKLYAKEVKRPFLFSASANLFSFGIGELINKVL
jgi:hypothetical protein